MESVLEDVVHRNRRVKDTLDTIVRMHFNDRDVTFALEKATQKGDNYIGVIYRITMSNRSDDAELSIILKLPPANAIQRKRFFARPCFLREALAYDEFLPLVERFQRSKGLAESEGFRSVAKCYATITEEMNEAIFLEDLRRRGYKMFDRFEEIDNNTVSAVMRTYGQLHAVSFALRDQWPEEFRPFQQIEDIFKQRRHDSQLAAYFEELKGSARATLRTDTDTKYERTLTAFFARGTFFEMLLDLIDGRKCEPYAVVCHGDCWNNNILFKDGKKAGEGIQTCLIDWQIMRYASPVTDVMYYLFTCTTKEFRQKYFNEMLNTYYRSLVDHIGRFGSNAKIVFSREVFENEVQKYAAIGLLMAMAILPITTIKAEDTPDLEALSLRIEAGDKTSLESSGLLGKGNLNDYSIKMRDVIIDCIEMGYI